MPISKPITVGGSVMHCFVVSINGAIQGIDQNSGGYPYPATRILDIHTFTTREEATQYASSFPGMRVQMATLTLKTLSGDW